MFQLMQSLRDEAVIQRTLRLDQDMADRFAAAARPRVRITAEDVERQMAMQRARSEAQAAAAIAAQPEFSPLPAAPTRAAPRAPQAGAEARLVAFQLGISRNDPCPCGSGQKYKKCCFDANAEPPPAASALGDLAAAAAAIGVSAPAEAQEGGGAPEASEPEDSAFSGGGWMPDDVGVLGGAAEAESEAAALPEAPPEGEKEPEGTV